tara:strand:- start:6813 stop:9506 length:2694 start_codon:yes stop_codon:yes gene_type:complete
MADEKDINNQKELNSEVEKNLSFEEEILFILNKRRGIDGETLKDQQDINNVLADQTKQLKFQIAEKRTITSLSNKISKIATSAYTVSRDEVGTSKTVNKLKKDQLDLDKTIQSLNFEKQKQLKEGKEVNIDVANSIEMQVKEATKLKGAISEIQEESSKVAKSLGSKSFGGLSKVVGSIPGLKGLSAPFEEAAEAARAQGAENLQNFGHVEGLTKAEKTKNKESNNQLDIQVEAKKNFDKEFQAQSKSGKARRTDTKVYQQGLKKAGINAEDLAKKVKMGKLPVKSIGTFKAGFASLGPVITKALGPLALIKVAVDIAKFFIDAMFAASKATADMSRNMLISRGSAEELFLIQKDITDEFKQQSKEQGYTTILTEDYRKALNDINSELGMQLNLTQDFGKATAMNVAEVARMQVNFGLSAKAATQLFLESEKAGVPLGEMNKDIFGTLGLMSVQSGLQMDLNKVMEEAAGISGNMRANFGGSTEEIAKGVFQAKLLGLNLSQMEGISGGLLDFQSSIENEMAAELLTGKQLNLERAREAALMGDTKTLMKEISEQAGSQEDFLAMNIIQRQALAKAVGMEVNELADMYKKKSENDALAEKSLKLQNQLQKEGIVIRKDADGNILNSMAEIAASAKATGKSEKEIRDILGGQVYLRKQEEDAQQKFNKALGHAKEAFANLVSGGALDSLVDIITGMTESSLFSGFKEEGEAKRIQKELQEKVKKDPSSVSQKELDIAESASDQVTGVEKVGVVAGAALTGAAIGSIIPGVGTAIGAVVGGLIGGITSLMAVEAVDYYKEGKAEQLSEIAKEKGIAVSPEVSETTKVDDFILRPGQAPIKFNKDDLLIGGTSLGGGSNSNSEVTTLLKELIATVKSGGDVYIDGAKAGKSMVMATSNLG